MTDCFVYDTVRTPRGKGKKDGALHEVTALELATQALRAVRDRNHLDTSKVDDVVLGCVDPVGEQGSNIARIAVMNADYADSVAGVQINRFCASGSRPAIWPPAQVMSGQHDMTIGGGVESMSRVGMGASGGAWPVDPRAIKSYFMPQGISADLIATPRRLLARRRRRLCRRIAEARRQCVGRTATSRSRRAGEGHQRPQTMLDHDEHMRPKTTCSRSPR
jgi:acetyl-CoA C-acetyltransferase